MEVVNPPVTNAATLAQYNSYMNAFNRGQDIEGWYTWNGQTGANGNRPIPCSLSIIKHSR